MPQPVDQKPSSPLSRLLLESRDSLYGYLFSMLGSSSDAEELFQEVALVILKKEKEGVSVANFPAWSREISRRTVLDHWKRRRADKVKFSDQALDAIDAAFQRNDRRNEEHNDTFVERLRSCLRRLPDTWRALVDLRYRGNRSIAQIAEQLTQSTAAVKMTLSRARARLAKCTRAGAPE